MTTQKKPPAAKRPGLPKMTVARFEESLELVERIAATEQTGFLQRMQDFRAQHRDISRRPLTAEEATRFTAGLSGTFQEQPDEMAARLQASGLYSYDEPAAREVLASAGLATAPALVRAVRTFVALIEMPAEEFEQACEDGTLADDLDEAAKAFRHVDMAEARDRTTAAFGHWGAQVGVASGEAMRRLVETVMGAFEQAAIRTMATATDSLAGSSSSTSSPEPMDGLDETSSTTSGT